MTTLLKSEAVEQTATGSSIAPRPSGRLRLFALSRGISSRAQRIIDAVHAGLWLGLLDRDQINAIVFQRYDDADLYKTAAHNLYGFFPSETAIIGNHFDKCESILVAAAGGGREMIALAKNGVGVDGFECNPGLVEKCKDFIAQTGISGRVLNALPDQVPPGLGQYDGAIVGFGALAHIMGRTNRIDFLSNLKGHLRPLSPLLLSVGRRPQGSRYYNLIYQIARAIRKLRRSSDPIELGDDLFDCFTHRFVETELRSELEEAGFKMLAYAETHEIYAVAQALD